MTATNLNTIILTAFVNMLFVFGFMLLCVSFKKKSSGFKTALQIMAFTYIHCAVGNALSFFNTNSDELLHRNIVMVIAVMQAFLFTYSLIILLNAADLTRKKVIREFIAVFTLSIMLLAVKFILSDKIVEICVNLFTLFYIYMLLRYVFLFRNAYTLCLKKMDNYFSGTEAERVRWINISFYAALGVGLSALMTELFPDEIILIIVSIIFFAFYLYFAVSFINYGFIYNELSVSLQGGNDGEELNKNSEKPKTLIVANITNIDNKLQIWLDNKTFVQQGITIDDTASALGTNRNYLSKYINSVVGKTFRQWINELRIEYSKTLMRENPDMSLNEISSATGFTDRSHFIRQFTKEAGVSPSRWKQKM